GCASFDRLSLVHRALTCPAGSRRCNSPGSLSRFCGCMARPCWVANGSVGTMGAGAGCKFFPSGAIRVRYLAIIAEDLGLITPGVHTLRDQFQIPGTRVLQFAFDGHADNPYLPGNFVSNTVVYTGTHDNATTREWYEGLPDYQRQNLCRYLQRAPGQIVDASPELIRLAWSSKAALAIAPLQDLLNLGAEARMNVPGRTDGNWRWRCPEEMLSPATFQWLQELTEMSQRFSVAQVFTGRERKQVPSTAGR